MKFRSAKDIIDVVRRRGMSIKVDPGPPPLPMLTGPRGVLDSQATEALMNALRAWRLEIIELVSTQHAEKNGVAP